MRKKNGLTQFGFTVKVELMKRGMEAQELASQIGTSPVQISRILHGEQPGYEIAPQIADILGIEWNREASA